MSFLSRSVSKGKPYGLHGRKFMAQFFSSSQTDIGGELIGDQNLEIFDRTVKRKQRDRAAWLMKSDDPVLKLATETLLDRLDDCKRKFPTALNLGGAFEHVKQLLGGRGGIQTMINMDVSPDMIERSIGKMNLENNYAAGSGLKNVDMVGDEELLPFKDGSLDLIISSLGLHWVNDLPGAIIQCRNALKPDGLFLASIFGGETLRELRIACTCAQLEREGGISPRISPLAQVRDAGNLLTRAGFALPAVDVDTFTVRYPSSLDLIEHLRSMGEGNAVRQRRQALRRDTALAAAAIYEAMFAAEDGSVPATFEVIYMAGWCPHPSQQKAKRRGSATASFLDIQEALAAANVQPEADARQPTSTDRQSSVNKSPTSEGEGHTGAKEDLKSDTVHFPSGSWYSIK